MTNAINNFALVDELPVHFIVGPHRAGTTFLQTLLGSMPSIGTCQETHFFCRVLPYLYELQRSERRFISFHDVKKAIIEIMFLGDNIVDFWDECEAAFLSGGYCRLFKYLIYKLAKRNICEIKVLLEKTPSHLLHINEINEILPEAKFVVIIRDPRAIAVSFLKYLPKLGQKERYGYILKEVKYLKSFFGAITILNHKSFKDIKIVKYEDLIQDEKGVLGEICNFLGIVYSGTYKKKYFDLARRIVLPGDIHKEKNVKNAASSDLQSWEKVLTVKERFVLDIYLNEIMLKFDYKPIYKIRGLAVKLVIISLNFWSRMIPPFFLPGTNKCGSVIGKYIPWRPSSDVSNKS